MNRLEIEADDLINALTWDMESVGGGRYLDRETGQVLLDHEDSEDPPEDFEDDPRPRDLHAYALVPDGLLSVTTDGATLVAPLFNRRSHDRHHHPETSGHAQVPHRPHRSGRGQDAPRLHGGGSAGPDGTGGAPPGIRGEREAGRQEVAEYCLVYDADEVFSYLQDRLEDRQAKRPSTTKL